MSDTASWLADINSEANPVVVTLSAEGHQAMLDEGHHAACSAINHHLGHANWEFSRHEIWPRQTPEFPPVWSVREAGCDLDILAWVDPGLHWLDGHFPGQPIVPGVALLHWTGILGQRFFERPLGCRQLKRVKFQAPVRPDTLLHLTLKNEPDRHQVAFRISSFDGRHAAGVLQ